MRKPLSPLAELQTNWKKWLAEGVIYYGILGGALALYMLYNKIMFGTSSPVSGQIKRWWGTMTNTVYERSRLQLDFPFSGSVFKELSMPGSLHQICFLWIAKIIRPLYPRLNTDDERYYIAMFIFVLLALILLVANTRRALQKVTKMALIPLGLAAEFKSFRIQPLHMAEQKNGTG